MTEHGGDPLDEIVTNFFNKLTKELHQKGFGEWVDPETGQMYELALNVAVGLKDLNEKVEYH